MGDNFNNQFTSLFWVYKGSNKDPSIFRMEILFMTLYKLGKLSILDYFV